MARRIDWQAIANFDPTSVQPDLWHTARHEAAHFLTAVHHGLVIGSVWLRLPGVGNGGNILNRGTAGSVQVYTEPVAGDIICTVAGAVADWKIIGRQALEDPGFLNDIRTARKTIRESASHPTYAGSELYRGDGFIFSKTELDATMQTYVCKAVALVDGWWGAVELLAAAFLVCVRRSKGSLHHTHVSKLYEMTKFMLRGQSFHAWVQKEQRA